MFALVNGQGTVVRVTGAALATVDPAIADIKAAYPKPPA